MKIKFEIKEEAKKLTDCMPEVTEEMWDKLQRKRREVFAELTRKLMMEPGYYDVHVMRDIQEEFPPGEIETQLLFLLSIREEIQKAAEATNDVLQRACEMVRSEKNGE